VYNIGGRREKSDYIPITVPESEEAQLFEGYNTQLKNSYEPICIFTKSPTAFPFDF